MILIHPRGCAFTSSMKRSTSSSVNSHGTSSRPLRLWAASLAVAAVFPLCFTQCTTARKVGAFPERTQVPLDDLSALIKSPLPSGAKTLQLRVVDRENRNAFAQGVEPKAKPAGLSASIPVPAASPSGKASAFSATASFPYPSRFAFPDRGKLQKQASDRAEAGSFAVTPTTPLSFASRDIGWVLNQIKLETREGYLVVSGKFTETSAEGFTPAAGDPFSMLVAPARTALGRPTSIVLSENLALQPAITVRETPVLAALRPGQTCKVPLNTRATDLFLEISLR
jgi:hypothetical protein